MRKLRFITLLLTAVAIVAVVFASCQNDSSDDSGGSEVVSMVWRGSFASADEIQNPADREKRRAR